MFGEVAVGSRQAIERLGPEIETGVDAGTGGFNGAFLAGEQDPGFDDG